MTRLALLLTLALAGCGRDPVAPPPLVDAETVCTLTHLADSTAVDSCQP